MKTRKHRANNKGSSAQVGLVSPGQTPPANQVGLTLIECLVAIVIVAIAAAIVAPAMVLSVATRVQSQRASQALDIAQSEIDRIRLLVERGDDYGPALPPVLPDAVVATLNDERELADVLGPNSLASTATVYTEAFPIDIDDDGNPDYAVQSFRTPGQNPAGGTVPVAFIMGVRVYEHRAVDEATTNLEGTEQASLTMTSGEGDRLERPLAALYSSIALSEDGQAFCNYIDYLASTTGTTASTPEGCN
jgi:prepilin-type N-terminal cleavage/methylation domain-containing protein